jgi:hypothetical protein
VVDELHHLPALSEYEPDVITDPSEEDASVWSRALLPMLESATLRLHLSGTLERVDGRAILWLPYQPVDEVLNWSSTHNMSGPNLRRATLCSGLIAEQRLRQRAATALAQKLARAR